MENKKDIGLYIHIPFCESKCIYCDFTSFVGLEDKVAEYVDCLIREIELYRDSLRDYSVRTIFFGGGTPSVIDERQIYRIMETIFKNYNTDRLEEVTIECNPGSLTLDKARLYKEAGINRVSMGAQSFDNDLLKGIGRIHKEEDIYRSLDILRKLNILNINLDLMFGLPGQSKEKSFESVEKAIELEIPHLSNYSLIIEEGTPIYRSLELGKFELMDEDMDRFIYHKNREILLSSGYEHYEISNFSKPGYNCIHNLIYWGVEPYLGLGLNSHSNLGGERFCNSNSLGEYLELLRGNKLAVVERENISRSEEIGEYMIMGLRKISGIDKKEFKARFDRDINEIYLKEIEKNIKNNLLEDKNEKIFLTELGMDLLNQVELDFFKI